MEELCSIEPAPGAKKVGDRCIKGCNVFEETIAVVMELGSGYGETELIGLNFQGSGLGN